MAVSPQNPKVLTPQSPKVIAGLFLTRDEVPNLMKAIHALADDRVMVGIPSETADRAQPGQKLNNAAIGYIQEHGAPEAHLPPRPHLFPTVRENKDLIAARLERAGKAALSGKPEVVERTLEGLGLTIVAKIRARIRGGIPPPLAPATVRARIARRKSPSWRTKRKALIAANVAAGHTIMDVTGATQTATAATPGVGVFTPLIDTGNYLAHLTYVVRRRGKTVKLGDVKK